MADTLESTGNYLPKDLRITAQPDAVDKDKFKVVATGLKISEAYVFQFQYVFEDGKTSEWSPSYSLLTNSESVPTAPSGTSVEGGAGFIKVSLPTFPANALRVDVKIAGGIFGDGTKVADSFTAAGTKTIAAPGSSSPGLAYTVTLLTITPSKISGQTTTATTVYVTDPAATLAVTAPEDPFAPTVRAGLASVIVEWSGKKSDGTDLTTTGFSGAKVHIGTSSGFTPSADNWVHTLNFANGSNRVSIGVGSIINKTSGATLAYGTPYYIKLVTINANGDSSGTVSASNNPVTVAKLPASEISTGILTADASITAGVDGGARVVMSGGPSPFIIYGTNGTTKLLEFIGGATGTLSITGSGSFTGDISGATGTLKNALTVGAYSNLLPGGYPFSVNASGYLYANSGKIGGWTLVGSTLESSTVGANNSKIKLDPDSPIIALMQNGVNKVTISADSGIVGPSVVVQGQSRTSFSLDPAGNVSLAGSIFSDSGKIAGWTISSITITSGGTTLNSSGAISLTGSTFSSGGTTVTAGNLTLQSGGITNNQTMFMAAQGFSFDQQFSPSHPDWTWPTWQLNTQYYGFTSRVTYNGRRYLCLISNLSSGPAPTYSNIIYPSTGKTGSDYYWVEEGNSYFTLSSFNQVHLGDRGTYFTDLGSDRNALSFRIYPANIGDGYFGRGYIMTALDNSEFRASTMKSGNNSGMGYKTVVVGYYGQLYNGRALYYGAQSSSSTINNEVGGDIGDIYFSSN